jgi:hypothetical protein
MKKRDIVKVCVALGTALTLAAVSSSCTDQFAPASPSTPAPTPGPSPFNVTYTVRATANVNGAISPNGAVSVSAGSPLGFKITADPNFQVADVQVDGSSVGAVTSYTFSNVVANHTITAIFAPNSLAGVFDGTMVLATVSGGECVGADLSARGGSMDQGTITITVQPPSTQAGAASPNPSALDINAFTRSTTTGLQCSYKGNAGSGFFSAGMDKCDATELFFQCANGARRILVPVGTTVTGSVTGNTVNGSVSTTYNVSDHEREPISALVVQQTFSAVRH